MNVPTAFSAECKIPSPKEVFWYNIKLYPVTRLHFWCFGLYEVTSSLPLFPGQLWPKVVVPVRILSMSHIDLFENYLYLIKILDTMHIYIYIYSNQNEEILFICKHLIIIIIIYIFNIPLKFFFSNFTFLFICLPLFQAQLARAVEYTDTISAEG